jgi:hypothetical protein
MHKEIGDLIVDRSEPLQMTRRLEAAHHLLAYPRWLVRVFCPVVQPLVLAVFDAYPQIPVRHRVAFELIGYQYTWGAPGQRTGFVREVRTARGVDTIRLF